MSKDDLSFAYRVEGAGRKKRSTVLRLMARAIDEPGLLDEHGLTVTWKWRNTPAQDMREDDFDSAVEGSRSGFVGLMRGRIARDLARVLDVEQRNKRPALPEPAATKTRKRRKVAPKRKPKTRRRTR